MILGPVPDRSHHHTSISSFFTLTIVLLLRQQPLPSMGDFITISAGYDRLSVGMDCIYERVLKLDLVRTQDLSLPPPSSEPSPPTITPPVTFGAAMVKQKHQVIASAAFHVCSTDGGFLLGPGRIIIKASHTCSLCHTTSSDAFCATRTEATGQDW